MTDKLASFQKISMSLTATHRVEVIFNGAEVLSTLNKEFETMAIEQSRIAINKMIKDKFPDVGEVQYA